MNFVVTGASGFIGSALCHYLLEKYPDKSIINVSKHTYAVSPRIARFLEDYPNYVFYPLDICDTLPLHEIMRKHEVERVYHLAAETHVDRSFTYPKDFLRSNIEGTLSVLEAIRSMEDTPRMFYMGTDEVFGDVKDGYKKEDEPLHPENPYVASKAAAEAYCTTWTHSFGIPVVIGRSMNVYGPRQNPEKLIAKIITHCLADEPYTLYKGNSIRGWNYVYDTAEAVEAIMTRGRVSEIYHIPPASYQTVNGVNNTILKLTGKPDLFEGYEGERLKDDYRYALDASKMETELGWSPRTSWEEGMTLTIEWYEKHKELWK